MTKADNFDHYIKSTLVDVWMNCTNSCPVAVTQGKLSIFCFDMDLLPTKVSSNAPQNSNQIQSVTSFSLSSPWFIFLAHIRYAYCWIRSVNWTIYFFHLLVCKSIGRRQAVLILFIMLITFLWKFRLIFPVNYIVFIWLPFEGTPLWLL